MIQPNNSIMEDIKILHTHMSDCPKCQQNDNCDEVDHNTLICKMASKYVTNSLNLQKMPVTTNKKSTEVANNSQNKYIGLSIVPYSGTLQRCYKCDVARSHYLVTYINANNIDEVSKSSSEMYVCGKCYLNLYGHIDVEIKSML